MAPSGWVSRSRKGIWRSRVAGLVRLVVFLTAKHLEFLDFSNNRKKGGVYYQSMSNIKFLFGKSWLFSSSGEYACHAMKSEWDMRYWNHKKGEKSNQWTNYAIVHCTKWNSTSTRSFSRKMFSIPSFFSAQWWTRISIMSASPPRKRRRKETTQRYR